MKTGTSQVMLVFENTVGCLLGVTLQLLPPPPPPYRGTAENTSLSKYSGLRAYQG